MSNLVRRLFGGGAAGGFGMLLAGPACLTCTLPMLWGALGAVGLFGAALWLHNLTPLVAVGVTVLLVRHARRHAETLPLRLAAAGLALIVLHFVLHFVPAANGGAVWVAADWAGVALLVAGVALDWRALRAWAACQLPAAEAGPAA